MRWSHSLLLALVAVACLLPRAAPAGEDPAARPYVEVRGIYGGMPTSLMEDGRTLADAGVNAVWIGERGIRKDRVEALHAQGAKVFAEFNTLHRAEYLEEHPDAAPVAPDGGVAEAPHGWQGICPTHEGYRRWRMKAFRRLLAEHEIDGVWLDYHHAHASWERADPALPDTCFCARCLRRFQEATDLSLHGLTQEQASARLRGKYREAWVSWRCGVFTDWVREFRALRDETRPKALLGTFHCPWSSEEHDGALRAKLAIDLRAQAQYVDVFSPMPYHARFGHATDPAWISRRTAWLARHLGLDRTREPMPRIWPIVQLGDWGEVVPVEQVEAVLDHGTRPPATGVMVFAWGSIRKSPEKVKAMARFYRAIVRHGTRAHPVFTLRFEPGEKGSRLAPRYSPKGSRIALTPRVEGAPEGVEALEGRIPLGPVPVRGEGHLLVLARSVENKPFDRLWIDTDGDGSLEDEETRKAAPRTRRGNVWTSYEAVMHVRHGTVGAAREPYPIGLWVVVEAEDAVPAFVRYSRRGFLVAPVTIDDAPWQVVLSDADNDAVYGEGDGWALLPVRDPVPHDVARSRRVGDFGWADRKAFRLDLEGTNGRVGRLVSIDPGLTPEEDARARDPCWDDKQAERAEAPVPFRRDVDEAIEEAQGAGRPYFLDFETTWCGPCKNMDRWVYTARDVARAAEGIVCIKVDGDERKDLKETHGVSSFPTGILFDAKGAEIARFHGYQSVAKMAAYFARAAGSAEDE